MADSNRSIILITVAIVAVLSGSAATEAGELTGQVTGLDGQPLRGAVVMATVAGSTVRTASGADGSFVLQLPEAVPPQLEITISAPNHQSLTLTITDPARPIRVELPARRLFSGEVEVTGTRATAGETPVTLSNVGREQIEKAWWGQDVPMFLSLVPGFYAYNDNGNDIGYSYFTLRGFDMSRTSVAINGVPLNDATSHGVFFIDLADFLATTGDIQVQRGVGTNLYGGSAIGGSVDLRTRHPLAERRLRASFTRGSWDTTRWSLEYDTGLIDNRWAATFRWSRIDSDGYRDQSWVEMWNYFATVEHYGERSTTRLVLFGGPEDTHLAYLGVPGTYLDGGITGDARRDRRFNPLTYPKEVDHFFQPHTQLVNTFHLADNLVLQNTLFYFQGNGYFEQYKYDRWFPEYGFEPFPGADGGLIDTTDLIRRRQVKEWDGGWIPRLEWRHSGGRGTLQAGAAIRLHQSHHWGEVTWAQYYPPGLPPNHRYYDYENGKQTVQPFIQETYRLSDRWTLLAGLTWTSHRYEIKNDRRNDVNFSTRYSFLLPRLGLTFKPADGWSLFGNISRGGHEPAFRDIYDAQDYWGRRQDLEEEKLTDYELGVERRWQTGFARLNLYWLHFDNEIVWAGGLDDLGEPVMANGAVADHRGVELEVAYNPRPRWGGRAAVSYASNTFDEFSEYDYSGGFVDHSGNRIAGSPDWLASLQLYGGIGPVDTLLTLRHVGTFYIDNTENLRKFPELRQDPAHIDRINPSQTVLDLTAEVDLGQRLAELIQADSVRLVVQVNNVTDELNTTFGYMDWEPVWIPAATRSLYSGITVDW